MNKSFPKLPKSASPLPSPLYAKFSWIHRQPPSRPIRATRKEKFRSFLFASTPAKIP